MQRTNAVVARPFFLVLQVAAALGVISLLAAGQRETGAARLRQSVIGRVCMPDGSPAAGAVVVTSAGGRAVTGSDGSFVLAVELPLEAESVEVTAVAAETSGSGSLVANARFAPAALSSTTPIGRLTLLPSTSCRPKWLPALGEPPGIDGNQIYALEVFDDGTGPALCVGGSFSTAGVVTAEGIARWDGTSWSALGSGVGGPPSFNGKGWVQSLTVYDDGSGPALYAGGFFISAGGIAANNIAKWDGSGWSALGSGVMGGAPTGVHALTVYDDGSGPALYAGGWFTSAGGVTANYIARWDGSSWSGLGSGMDVSVSALAVYDDGSGQALYAGGGFTTAGGVAASRIARWNGTS